MKRVEEFKVQKGEEKQRLDKYIVNKKSDLSRMMIKKLIEEKQILVNGKETKTSYLTQIADAISIHIPETKNIDLKAQNIPLNIVYEDNHIIVVNKPKGMVVHPAVGNPDGTLVNAIMAHCKSSLSGIGGELRPGIVHRLDKDTSGLLIIAKNDNAHIEISKQIQNREVTKIYLCLVRGNVPEEEASIDMPIGRSTKDRKKMAVTPNGKKAITHFKVLQRFGTYTFLEVKIETGRTHQIRVHMAEIGHPIVGDMVYSNGKNEFGVQGQMLHAKKLSFKHPVTKQEIHLEAQLPEYFEQVLQTLQKQLEK